MKNTNIIITVFLLFAALTLVAQSYSPCYTNNMSKGNTAFSQGKYSEARTYYTTANQCAGGNPTEAQKKIAACDAKIKAQKEAAEAKRKEEEAKRKAEQEAAEAKRKAEQEAAEVKRKAEAEVEAARQRAIDEAKSRGYEYITVNGVTFKMVYVQGGTFTMGCTSEQGYDCYGDEKPSHQVTLSDYWIGETEVTQALWKAVMGSEPSYNGGWTNEYGRGDSYPAYRVSWDDCQEFIRKLNQLTGKTFRLPTEAEWEYAARGGNMSKGYKYAGSNSIDDVAWYKTNTNDKGTEPVKTKLPNELGLYDMSGNVYEWCSDWYGYYISFSQTNPTGPATGSRRVFRGGSWFISSRSCRVSYRSFSTPDYRSNIGLGFRLSLVR